jgi:predicted Zn-dependent protease
MGWPCRLLAIALVASGCATVPETGRSQLVLVDADELRRLSMSEWQNLKANTPISTDPDQNALVQNAGWRIAAVAPVKNADWEFVVFDEPEVLNAFALPGGKVGVYSGLFTMTQNEPGLATVLGHEVAHVVANHGAERVSHGLLVELGGVALSVAAGSNPSATSQLIQAAYGIGTSVGVMLPYSRKHELEADQIGLMFMARAGYDPKEAVAFWQRFAESKAGSGQPPEFLSTHPVDEKRISELQRHLPKAEEEYERAQPRASVE